MTLFILENAPCDGVLAVAALNVVERDHLVEFVDEQTSADGRHDILFRVDDQAPQYYATINAALFRHSSGRAYFVLDAPTLPSYNVLLQALRERAASRPFIHIHNGHAAVISMLLAPPSVLESRRDATIVQGLRRARSVLALLEPLVGIARDFDNMRLQTIDDYNCALVTFERRRNKTDNYEIYTSLFVSNFDEPETIEGAMRAHVITFDGDEGALMWAHHKGSELDEPVDSYDFAAAVIILAFRAIIEKRVCSLRITDTLVTPFAGTGRPPRTYPYDVRVIASPLHTE